MSDQLSQFRQHHAADSTAPDLPQVNRRKTFRIEVLVGIILLAGGVVAAFWIRQAGTSTVQVLGVSRELPAGHVITETDLLAVDVNKGVDNQFIRVDAKNQITGGVLSSDVPVGPLSRAAVRPAQQVLAEGEALIASAMEQGTFPPSMSPGDVVEIVITPSLTDLEGKVERLDQTAVVFSVMPSSDFNTKTIVTLRAQSTVAERIAASGPVHLAIVAIGGVQ
jgi:hypothetical protein